jgi:hypothetical protein
VSASDQKGVSLRTSGTVNGKDGDLAEYYDNSESSGLGLGDFEPTVVKKLLSESLVTIVQSRPSIWTSLDRPWTP